MCSFLKMPRSTYYYHSIPRSDERILIDRIIEIFRASRNNYGGRKIKAELAKLSMSVSRRRIRRIMKSQCLVSNYTIAQYKAHNHGCNESVDDNIVERNFKQQMHLNVVVSDLTYVLVGTRWNYICILVDLFNLKIIGYSAGARKDATLVSRAFAGVKGNLNQIQIFHTDRGNEFNNHLIPNALHALEIKRSLSTKECPYDHAVAEATFKIIKTEFAHRQSFASLNELNCKLSEYVNWFNYHRIHSSLQYLTPMQFKYITLKNVV